jgi:uncharacterized protein YbaA (DUF1428 family)
MPNYVDGFVLPIPNKNIKIYSAMARKCAKIWTEHGALAYFECISDDVSVGKVTSFPRSVKLKSGETAFFSFIIYKSRAERNRVNKAVMKDPRMAAMMKAQGMPFDGKRMIFGGFKSVVALGGPK